MIPENSRNDFVHHDSTINIVIRCHHHRNISLNQSTDSSAGNSHVAMQNTLFDAAKNALFNALHQLSGTHYRKLFSVVILLQFLSLG